MKKFLSTLMILVLAATLLLPAFSLAEGGADTSKEVKLIMYRLGDRTADFDTVFAKINEKLQEKINATLEVKFMSWGEWEQKYPLVFASGEDFDIIYSADWAMYNSQASKPANMCQAPLRKKLQGITSSQASVKGK